jgi:hypothetical protein
MNRSDKLKMKNQQNIDKIKYIKEDESLEMNVVKVDRENISNMVELETHVINDIIINDETTKLSIAPNRIKDIEIKKPEEKEPSFFQMIKYKIKGEANDKNKRKDSDDKLDKL